MGNGRDQKRFMGHTLYDRNKIFPHLCKLCDKVDQSMRLSQVINFKWKVKLGKEIQISLPFDEEMTF